jgi:type IV secretory pathway TrbD component
LNRSGSFVRRRDLPEQAVHPALVKPVLLGGAERELVVMELLLGMVLLAAGQASSIALTGVAALLLVHYRLLVPAAQADPDLAKVYLRSLQYRSWYPARCSVHAPCAKIQAGR